MSVRVQCGACGAPYAVAEALLGNRVKCKKCGTVFVAEPAPVEAKLVADGADDEYDVADRDSFLVFEGKGAKRFLKATPVPPRAP